VAIDESGGGAGVQLRKLHQKKSQISTGRNEATAIEPRLSHRNTDLAPAQKART
jgi:hypothetical protein